MIAASNLTTTNSFQEITAYTINQVLVGFEVGQTDEALLNYLNFWSSQIPSKAAYFLHVFREDSALRMFYEQETEMVVGPFKIDETVIDDMSKKITSYITTDKMEMEYHAMDGNALTTLLSIEEEISPDLMVIGQNTEKIHHTILASNLIRKNTCDVLVIPNTAQPQLRKIVVPIDFSTNSIKALRRAISINRQLEKPIPIVCLHFFSVPNLSIYQTAHTINQIRVAIEEDRQKAFEYFLLNYVPKESDRTHIQPTVIEQGAGSVGDHIVAFAKNKEGDLIIMGAKGHSKTHLLIMGSVTESVLLANKHQPILVVK